MFLKSLTLSNILSFGPEPHTVELGPLNVIIGPNGSGKSNFIEAIGLLKAAPRDIREPIREGGGVDEWIWKGASKGSKAAIKSILQSESHSDIHYSISFSSNFGRLHIDTELISSMDKDEESLWFGLELGVVSSVNFLNPRTSSQIGLDNTQSILSQPKPNILTEEIVSLAETFAQFEIVTDLPMSRDAPVRRPQKVDSPNTYLASDASNLGLIVNRLRRNLDTREKIRTYLQEIYEKINDVDVQIEGGTVQVFVYEGRSAIPATRMSSGTLRFLCLLAILCHPEPPPLICIEEPELGLHPDLIPTVSKLLKEASERTQLIVTTHSDILIDTLTERSESVLVAEKGEDGTRLTRLDPDRLKPWLEKYRLGQLWTSGEIGGTRW